MSLYKKNKTVARLVVVGGTLAAGLGIWAGVSGHALPTASSGANTAATDPNFSPTDGFLSQSGSQPGLSPAQTAPSRPTVQTARLRTRGS